MPTRCYAMSLQVYPSPVDRRSTETSSESTEKIRRSSPAQSSQRRTAAAEANRLRSRRTGTSAEAISETRQIFRNRNSDFLFRWAHRLSERWKAVGVASGWDIESGFGFSNICRVCCRTIGPCGSRSGGWSRSSCRRSCWTFLDPVEVWRWK